MADTTEPVPPADGVYQIGYPSNLLIGDSYVNPADTVGLPPPADTVGLPPPADTPTPIPDASQIGYPSNLLIGDSYVNLSNAGTVPDDTGGFGSGAGVSAEDAPVTFGTVTDGTSLGGAPVGNDPGFLSNFGGGDSLGSFTQGMVGGDGIGDPALQSFGGSELLGAPTFDTGSVSPGTDLGLSGSHDIGALPDPMAADPGLPTDPPLQAPQAPFTC